MAKTKRPSSSAYTISKDGKLTYVLAQTYGCSCPKGHKTFTYKSRLPAEDIDVRCPHCGVLCLVTQRL